MTQSTEMFFALLNLSINENRYDNSSLFVNTTKADWEELFALSARQGTVLLAYGGIQYLPAELQPPRKLKLRWVANVIKGSERYDHYGRTIAKLSNLFSKYDIDLLIIKGLTISELYPVAYYREGGDVDVYLFGKAEQANKLLPTLGIEVQYPIPKHSAFMFDGLMIENHQTFFDTDIDFRRESRLYEKMENMLMSMFSADDCPPLNIGSALKLPPQAAALYMIGHTFRHFCCIDINVRQLCDWTVFFTKCANDIDHELLAGQLKELGLEKFVADINSFCYHYLGFRSPFFTAGKRNKKTERLILKMVMSFRVSHKVHVPAIGVLRHIFLRNKVYKKYLGKVKASEFRRPELKSYFSYQWKRITRSGK